jgi:hypothetical protein
MRSARLGTIWTDTDRLQVCAMGPASTLNTYLRKIQAWRKKTGGAPASGTAALLSTPLPFHTLGPGGKITPSTPRWPPLPT